MCFEQAQSAAGQLPVKSNQIIQLQRLCMLQNQMRDVRQKCKSTSQVYINQLAQFVEDVRGLCRDAYKAARKQGVHQASIDFKASAGRAFDWKPGFRTLLSSGVRSFQQVIILANEGEPLPDGFCFSDLWRYQVCK